MKRKILTGQKFGRLLALEEVGKFVKAQCDCGKVVEVWRGNLMAGYTKSCGCYRNEQTSKANTTHGLMGTPAYRTWKAMKIRCTNTLRHSSHRYVNRGITYCPEWEDFENFYKDMGDRPVGMELDRIDNNKGYYKENCRWTTHKENCNNKG